MKTAMANQPIGLSRKFSSAWNIFRSYRQGIFGNPESAVRLHSDLRSDFVKHTSLDVQGARILDLGCGQLAQQTILFSADGARVTGIDIEVPTFHLNLKVMHETVKKNGIERAFKSLIRHLLYDKKYFQKLSELYERPVSFADLDLRIMDATALAFPENEFDYVYSMWVFEHINDVPKAVQEINRVLKPLGLARISIHLFPSLSGGHHLDWIFPDKKPSVKVPPWDHLLDNNFPVNAYLNRHRLDDFRDMFRRHFDVVDEKLETEGSQFLTKELLKTLQSKEYTREDLLSRTVTFYCKKK